MPMNAFTIAAIALGSGAVATLTGSIVKRSRSMTRQRRRDQLRSIARTNHLSLLDGDLPTHLNDRVRRHGSAESKLRVEDVLAGRDSDGSYYFGTRKGGDRDVQVLLFDANKDTRIDGLVLAPRRRGGTRRAIRRWFNNLLGRNGFDPIALELYWSCRPADLIQEGLLERASAALRTVALASASSMDAPMGIMVDGRRIAIASERALGIKEYEAFIQEALHLRRQVLDAVLDARFMGSTGSRAIQPIARAIHEVASTQRREPISKEHLLQKQSSVWSMAMDVPEEDTRKSGYVRPLKKEEEVVVLTGSGMEL